MPRASNSVPKYRAHKPSGQAVVTIGGQDLYLGPWQSTASKVEYDRLIGEWLAAGRPAAPTGLDSDLRIVELINAYRKFAEAYYVKDGRPTRSAHNMRPVLALMNSVYGQTRAAEFGPLALKAIMLKLVAAGDARVYVNKQADMIRRMFRWAVSEEMLPPSTYQALRAVPNLRKGRTEAAEKLPVKPVSDAVVEATIPFLPPIVADMVRFQQLTGCRPGEVCVIRPCDVDTTGEAWRYTPRTHKGEHHDRERVIFIGPKAQDVLRPYLLREKTAVCFSPAESERERNAERRNRRQSPMTPSQAKRGAKRNRRLPPSESYTPCTFRQAVRRAAAKADKLARAQDKNGPGVELWAPNRLRHATATKIRQRYGLEGAQVALGHSQADVTQIYAERDLALAARIMREVG